jgi:hypothetical protein
MVDSAAETVKKMSLGEDAPSSSDKKPVAIIVIGKENLVIDVDT